MRFEIVRILRDLLLCGGDGLPDAAEFKVEVGQTILQRL